MPDSTTPPFLDALLGAFARGLLRAWQVGAEGTPPAPRVRRTRTPRQKERAPTAPPPAPPRPRSGHEIVTYRQGRGSFEARIVRFDSEKKELVLERLSDGKRVVRPASKVHAAGK